MARLNEIACKEGRETRPNLKLGMCGEHGGDPSWVEFCDDTGLDYVSSSPFRAARANIAVAQVVLKK